MLGKGFSFLSYLQTEVEKISALEFGDTYGKLLDAMLSELSLSRIPLEPGLDVCIREVSTL